MLERGLDAKAEDEEVAGVVAGRVVEKKEASGIGSHLLGRADSDPTWSADLACHTSKNVKGVFGSWPTAPHIPRRRCGGRIGRRSLGTVWRHRRQTKQAFKHED